MSEIQTQTKTATFDDVAKLFDSAPSADNIITKQEEPTVLTKEKSKVNDVLDQISLPKEPEKPTPTVDSIIKDVEDKAVTAKTEVKAPVMDLYSKLIEEGTLFGFDDEKPITEYNEEDIKLLIAENLKEAEKKGRQDAIPELFDSLPEELQYAFSYVANGTNIKGLFKALTEVNEIKDYDISKPEGQEETVRQYLRSQEWTDEEIQSELADLKDAGKLPKIAEKYKPKLEKMKEELVETQLAQAEERKKQQLEAAKYYVDNVFEVLKQGKLGKIELDKKLQSRLYAGMTENQFRSITGKPTNKLGYLLEKYQYLEPNYEKVIKALWLLEDEEGFLESIKTATKEDVTAETVKLLKTEQARRKATAQPEEADRKKLIQRPGQFFKR